MPITSNFPAPAGVPTEPQNVHNLLFRTPAALAQPDYTAHIDARTGERRTYRQLVARIYDGATALGTLLGLDPQQGHMVGILSANCMEYIPFYHACLVATVPVAFLPSLATAHELRHALELSKCTHLFVHPDLLQLARKSVAGMGLSDERIYLLERDSGGVNDGRVSFPSLIDKVKKRNVPPLGVRKAERDTLAYLIFSSGTSGLPKGM
jgi:acyl-CoA synthetase (AMP-forming)/AMP-acid ligase II